MFSNRFLSFQCNRMVFPLFQEWIKMRKIGHNDYSTSIVPCYILLQNGVHQLYRNTHMEIYSNDQIMCTEASKGTFTYKNFIEDTITVKLLKSTITFRFMGFFCSWMKVETLNGGNRFIVTNVSLYQLRYTYSLHIVYKTTVLHPQVLQDCITGLWVM